MTWQNSNISKFDPLFFVRTALIDPKSSPTVHEGLTTPLLCPQLHHWDRLLLNSQYNPVAKKNSWCCKIKNFPNNPLFFPHINKEKK